ncbi:MAG: hypothetical protein AABW87_03875 [Nanoarchaeota archaeon]
MLTEKEILDIAKQALNYFKIKCEIKFLPISEFKKVAGKSRLISQVLDEGWTFEELKIPSLIYHEKKEHIYLNQQIISSIVKKFNKKTQKDFVRSVIYHELFHIMHEHELQKNNFIECLKSEERVCDSFREKYPALYKIGYELHKEAAQI